MFLKPWAVTRRRTVNQRCSVRVSPQTPCFLPKIADISVCVLTGSDAGRSRRGRNP